MEEPFAVPTAPLQFSFPPSVKQKKYDNKVVNRFAKATYFKGGRGRALMMDGKQGAIPRTLQPEVHVCTQNIVLALCPLLEKRGFSMSPEIDHKATCLFRYRLDINWVMTVQRWIFGD